MTVLKRSFMCPAEVPLKLVCGKWKLLILWELSHGTRRFSDLLKNIKGVSQKVLTQSLRTMESDGLIFRHVYAEIPPRVEYEVTPVAEDLAKILDIMGNWGMKYLNEKGHTQEWTHNARSPAKTAETAPSFPINANK